jgi:colanic acid/amylovoran biosynthesis glycosyltransferase
MHAMGGKSSRIAYITDVFPGITLTFVYLEVRRLRQKGMHIDLYAIWQSKQKITSREADSFGAETTYLSPPPIFQLFRGHGYYAWEKPKKYLQILKLCLAQHPNARLRRRTVYNFLLAPYLATLLANKHTTHIHAHFASGASTVAIMASELLDINFSFTAHRGDIFDEKILLYEKLKKAKFAIAISEYNRACLLREAPDVEASKVKTIHCGVEIEVFSPCQRTHGGPPVFLAVGSLLQRKGHRYLLEACRILRSEGKDYRCIIVGDGPERLELEKLVRKYGVEDQVELAGAVPHEDILLYYDQADIFVHPSLSEGIPVVLMEAMSKELPVIATRITGVPELVSHEEDGLLVGAAESAELAEAMMRLLTNVELRIRLGKNAREKILRDFNLDVNTAQIKELFKESDTLRPRGNLH